VTASLNRPNGCVSKSDHCDGLVAASSEDPRRRCGLENSVGSESARAAIRVCCSDAAPAGAAGTVAANASATTRGFLRCATDRSSLVTSWIAVMRCPASCSPSQHAEGPGRGSVLAWWPPPPTSWSPWTRPSHPPLLSEMTMSSSLPSEGCPPAPHHAAGRRPRRLRRLAHSGLRCRATVDAARWRLGWSLACCCPHGELACLPNFPA
jgi:hypothetical protein